MTQYLDKLVQDLESIYDTNCITIYMQLFKSENGSKENIHKLNILLRKAIHYLEQGGMSNREIREFFEPIKQEIENGIIAKKNMESLLVCLNKNFIKLTQLPFLVTEDITINNHFDLELLKKSYVKNSDFYLLAISKNEVTFYKCDQFDIEQIDLEELPHKFVKKKTMENQLQKHSAAAGHSQIIFHGHHGDTNFDKNLLDKFLRTIDHKLASYLSSHKEPLILATTDETYALYKHVNSYKNLAGNFVSGCPDKLNQKELHQKAWETIFHNLFEKTCI